MSDTINEAEQVIAEIFALAEPLGRVHVAEPAHFKVRVIPVLLTVQTDGLAFSICTPWRFQPCDWTLGAHRMWRRYRSQIMRRRDRLRTLTDRGVAAGWQPS